MRALRTAGDALQTMPRFIAFLRAINVGGRTVKMETLRSLFEDLRFDAVETFIASGNVIFTSRSQNGRALERTIEGRVREALGYEVSTFVRTDAELAAIARYRPFSAARLRAAGALNIGFVAEPLSARGKKALMALRTEIDDFHARGREVFWLCTTKQGESDFSNAVFEKRLQVRATFRGANTLARLAAKYPPSRGA